MRSNRTSYFGTVSPNERAWRKELKTVVEKYILSKVTSSQEIIKNLLSDEIFVHWEICFTSPFVSTVNYESFETLGDAVVELLLNEKAIEEFPGIKPDELNNMRSHYVTNEFQSKLLDGVALDGNKRFIDYMRIDKNMVDNDILFVLKGDLYEAIYGALYFISEFYYPGYGCAFCKNLFSSFYKDTKLDRFLSNNQNLLKQIFKRFNLSGSYEIPEPVPEKRKTPYEEGNDMRLIGFRWYLPPRTVEFLSNMIAGGKLTLVKGKYLPDAEKPLIRDSYKPPEIIEKQWKMSGPYVVGDTKKIAKEKAAVEALEFLKEIGITPEWARGVKITGVVSGIDERNMSLFMNRLKTEGYSNYEIRRLPPKFGGAKTYIFQLFGIPEDKNEEATLLSTKKGGNMMKVKHALINDYALESTATTSTTTRTKGISIGGQTF